MEIKRARDVESKAYVVTVSDLLDSNVLTLQGVELVLRPVKDTVKD